MVRTTHVTLVLTLAGNIHSGIPLEEAVATHALGEYCYSEAVLSLLEALEKIRTLGKGCQNNTPMPKGDVTRVGCY